MTCNQNVNEQSSPKKPFLCVFTFSINNSILEGHGSLKAEVSCVGSCLYDIVDGLKHVMHANM